MNIENSNNLEDERKRRKTSYFSNFALKNFSDMKILSKGGILGKENKDWRNISEHCLAEAVGADILAEDLGADRKKVVRAVLIHDWYKRKEVEAMKKIGGVSGHKQASVEDERLLREYGIDEEIIKLSHSNIPDSADSIYLKNRSLEEKIIHYIDMATSDSDFMDFNERLDIVEKKKTAKDFSESYREKYNGKALNELQREISTMEQEEFEKTLNIQQGTLIDFIKEKLKERI